MKIYKNDDFFHYFDHKRLSQFDYAGDDNCFTLYKMPTLYRFEEYMNEYKVSDTEKIICYDKNGVTPSAARAAWMLRYFGM